MCYKQCKFGCDQPLIKGTLLEEQCSFLISYLAWKAVFWKSIYDTPCSCHTILWSVNNEGQFTWRECTFLAVTRLPVEQYSWKSAYSILYKLSYCHWSKNQGTLLEEQCTFWDVSPVSLEGFSWKFISVIRPACSRHKVCLPAIGQ